MRRKRLAVHSPHPTHKVFEYRRQGNIEVEGIHPCAAFKRHVCSGFSNLIERWAKSRGNVKLYLCIHVLCDSQCVQPGANAVSASSPPHSSLLRMLLCLDFMHAVTHGGATAAPLATNRGVWYLRLNQNNSYLVDLQSVPVIQCFHRSHQLEDPHKTAETFHQYSTHT